MVVLLRKTLILLNISGIIAVYGGEGMAKYKNDHITSCTITWSDWQSRVVTRVLQTEIQVRYYDYFKNELLSGRIWPMTAQQKQELYDKLDDCLYGWECDDFSAENDSICWQFKICTQHKCLRTVRGTIEPPPHGDEIKKQLIKIIGEKDCHFF